ncbi:MAG TPA: hypothetical protein VN249_02825, partial [Prolixibacteraceae bacterium]|nr:hypothetical protein [Prolixibacteraceae bacterium]
MALSIAPLVVSLAYSLRLKKFSKVNNLPHWEKFFTNSLVFAAVLAATEAIFTGADFIKWIWHLYLVALLVVTLQQEEFRSLKMYIVAFIPFVAVSLLRDLTDLVSSAFYTANEGYFKTAEGMSLLWLVALLFSQNRQNKALEKERIKRQHEDELNRAIAIRKVELEELVNERTAELTKQKEELELTLEELR